MAAASDPDIKEIVFVKPRQVGGTECILNIIGHSIHADPVPQLYACEDEKKADEWSKLAFAPMLHDTPVLHALVRDKRIRDSGNTIKAKSYPGGQLVLGWATSSATATSRSNAKIYFDERDAYKETDLGDYCKVAEPSLDTWQPDTLIVKVSTPGDRLENPAGTPLDAPRFSPIEREFHESDQRRYYVPCPHCGEFQVLKFKNLRWDKDPLAAYYICGEFDEDGKKVLLIKGCGAVIEERHKTQMLARGEWRQENPDGQRVPGRAGFHLNKLYSPFVAWGQMAEAFVTAKRSGDPGQLKAFVTMWLAEGWEPPQEKIETSEITDRCEDYGGSDGRGGEYPMPIGVCLLVAGVDVHPDRLECEILGFGLNLENWSADYVVVWGDPTKAETWERLKSEVITREFKRADGVTLKVACTAIDSGGGFTNEVYAFAYANRGYRVFAVKGASTAGKPIVGKPTEAGRPKIKLFLVGTEAAKDTFITNLHLKDQGPGYCHFPLERAGEQGRVFYGEDHFKQLLSERPRMKKGARVWEKIRESARNEALDCRVYAMAAYYILNPDMGKIHALLLRKAELLEPKPDSEGEPPPETPPTSTPPAGKSRLAPRRPGGFVRRPPGRFF